MFNSYFVLHFNLAYLVDQTHPSVLFGCRVRAERMTVFEYERSCDEETLFHIHKHPLAIIPAI